MRFEKSDVVLGKRGMKTSSVQLMALCSDFLKSGIEVAEVKGWGEDYKNAQSCRCAIHNVIQNCFKGQMRVASSGNKIFIARLDK